MFKKELPVFLPSCTRRSDLPSDLSTMITGKLEAKAGMGGGWLIIIQGGAVNTTENNPGPGIDIRTCALERMCYVRLL